MLKQEPRILICPYGHSYPVIEGIPVMLIEEKISTQPQIFSTTFKKVKIYQSSHESDTGQPELNFAPNTLDPYVQSVISAVCGRIFEPFNNKLTYYPIPELPLGPGNGDYFLDIGCNWGRWSISAVRLGYKAIGIDHNLDAIIAARRVARQLGISAYYLVADGRYLPFLNHSFNLVFSYSVLQHFNREDAGLCLSEISRVLEIRGAGLIQMPNVFGLMNMWNQLKRLFKKPENFDVRYWRPLELVKFFTNRIGPTSLIIDGFFSLNPQYLCRQMLPYWFLPVVLVSYNLKRLSRKIVFLKYLADSLYVKSIKK